MVLLLLAAVALSVLTPLSAATVLPPQPAENSGTVLFSLDVCHSSDIPEKPLANTVSLLEGQLSLPAPGFTGLLDVPRHTLVAQLSVSLRDRPPRGR